MNYTELKTNIEDICENSFTDDQLAMFTQQAEQKIYNTVQIPALRKVDTGPLTASTRTYTVPADFLYTYSLAILDGTTYTYLLNKDVNFLREAYPDTSVTGAPKHYAYYDEDKLVFGPTPDENYVIEHTYGYYPESIVTAGTTWLGNEFDSALLNGALIEAIRFMKGEQDIVANYEKMFLQSITLLKQLGDGKLREDAYRSGQFRAQVG